MHERIVESIRSGLITTDLHGRIYTFNAAAEEITGYKAVEVSGQDASMFFGDMRRQIADSMAAASDGKVSPRFEIDCLTQSGFMLRLGFSIAPLFAESRETTGLVITFQDLTDVRVMEETARRQDRLAAVGFRAVSLWVLEGNRRARAFYERWGFRTDGARQVIDLGRAVPEIRYYLQDVDARSP